MKPAATRGIFLLWGKNFEGLAMTPADTLVPSVSEQSQPLAGTVRLRRSTPLAIAILFAVVVIAVAGVTSGLRKASGGFPPGYALRPAHARVNAAPSATPYAAETAPAADAQAATVTKAPAKPAHTVVPVKSEEDPDVDDTPAPAQQRSAATPADDASPPDINAGPPQPQPDNGPRQGDDDRGPGQPLPR
jgi:hypothetical protein